MDLRQYQKTDKDGCLAVFDSNVPDSFNRDEREEYAGYLDRMTGTYFVLDHDGAIVGCGGYASESGSLASITWLMVKKEFHRNGLGRLLVFNAMRKLSAELDPMMVRLETTPEAAPFFSKQGFRIGESLRQDRVEMVKKLKVCP